MASAFPGPFRTSLWSFSLHATYHVADRYATPVLPWILSTRLRELPGVPRGKTGTIIGVEHCIARDSYPPFLTSLCPATFAIMRVVPETNWYFFSLRTAQALLSVVGFWFGTFGLMTILGGPGWISAGVIIVALSVLNWFLVTPAIQTLSAYLHVRWTLETPITLEEARQLAPHLNRDIGAADVDAIINASD